MDLVLYLTLFVYNFQVRDRLLHCTQLLDLHASSKRGEAPALNTMKGLRVLVFREVWAAPDQGIVGVTQLFYRQANRPRVQAVKPYHTIPYPPY